MSSSMGNMAFGASEKTADTILSLKTVQKMLPLVRQIVDEILNLEKKMQPLSFEQERLETKKRALPWPERQRRYKIQDEIAAIDKSLVAAVDELHELGLALLDQTEGRIGFPTMVNNRRAFFSWKPGEESPCSWHFAEESVCRPIPAAWLKELSLTGKA